VRESEEREWESERLIVKREWESESEERVRD